MLPVLICDRWSLIYPSLQNLLETTQPQKSSWRHRKNAKLLSDLSSGTPAWSSGLTTGLSVRATVRCWIKYKCLILVKLVFWVAICNSNISCFQEVYNWQADYHNHNVFASNFIPLWVKAYDSGLSVFASKCFFYIKKHHMTFYTTIEHPYYALKLSIELLKFFDHI